MQLPDASDPRLAPHRPSSLLTFLIADIRGYTAYTARHGDEATALLTSRFADLAQEVAAAHAGEVTELQGDEVLAVFSSARAALRAAVALRVGFSDEIGQGTGTVIGIGLDAGDAVPVKNGYRTGALNLAARLQGLARGEVFASETVIALAGTTEGLAFVDRGQVTVKGLPTPVRVYSVGREGELPARLPPLAPEAAASLTNLPDAPTPFIGREREIAQVAALLQEPQVRLVTLTGPGGTGKTRLALQVGRALLPAFRDGVLFCDLSPLTDPALVPSAIAGVVGVREEGGRTLLEALIGVLGERRLLLILDNFEHLLEARDVVASLLEGCREVCVIVTSRTPLHLSREHEHAVPPLSVPDPEIVQDVVALSQHESVALFLQQARAVRDSFTLTGENAHAVAEICYRLDGLPLAIELAAARIKLFPPQALLSRLSKGLALLTGGAKDRPARQQTLRNAIDWSYSLLTVEERTLFARLSVFAGGCTFEAADEVAGSQETGDVLEGLAGLVDKSLIRGTEDLAPRFSMLETIREYAAECLNEMGGASGTRDRHADYYLALGSEIEGELGDQEYTMWLDRMQREHDNLRAALAWLLEAGRPEAALQLTVVTAGYWHVRGHYAEGQQWLERALAAGNDAPPPLRLQALGSLAYLSLLRGEHDRGGTFAQERVRLAREWGDPRYVASALGGLGANQMQLGNSAEAERLLQESLDLYRQMDAREGVAQCLHWLGEVALNQQQYERAVALMEECVAIRRKRGRTSLYTASLDNLARAVLGSGDPARAARLWQENVRLSNELRDRRDLAFCFEGLAAVAASRGEAQRATRLFGAADALRQELETPLAAPERAFLAPYLARARQENTDAGWQRAWDEGRAMSLEEAVAFALGDLA